MNDDAAKSGTVKTVENAVRLVLLIVEIVSLRRRFVAADDHRTVSVVQHVVTDAAEDRPSKSSKTSSTEYDHRDVLGTADVDDCLAWTTPVLHQHAAFHLQ